MYRVLSQEEQDDIIVAYMLSQERDKYCHELNLARYNAMERSANGDWGDRINKLKAETEVRLAEVNSVIAETEKQLPPRERLEAAIIRLKSKE